MTNKELVDILKTLPDDVEVYREADHGQTPERCPGVYIACVLLDYEEEFPYYGEDINWKPIRECTNYMRSRATAVLIG